MSDASATSNVLSNVTLTNLSVIVLAIGSLGTAAYGFVDATKPSEVVYRTSASATSRP